MTCGVAGWSYQDPLEYGDASASGRGAVGAGRWRSHHLEVCTQGNVVKQGSS